MEQNFMQIEIAARTPILVMSSDVETSQIFLRQYREIPRLRSE